MKFCARCEHCKKGFNDEITHQAPPSVSKRWPPEDWQCNASEADDHRDPVTGEWPRCSKVRLSVLGCGKIARWYKEKKEDPF